MSRDKDITSLSCSFISALSSHDKIRCIQLVKDALDADSISIPELYENVLARSLYLIATNEKEQQVSIWEEHIQSGIVRSVVENTYPYIMKFMLRVDTSQKRPVAIVFCQEEEYHDLGARMVTDFLTLLGFSAFFIGANTPAKEAFAAITVLKPRLVCVSGTNYFHLTKLQGLINGMRSLMVSGHAPTFSIVVGGYSLKNTPGVKEQIIPDYFAYSYSDLAKISEAIL